MSDRENSRSRNESRGHVTKESHMSRHSRSRSPPPHKSHKKYDSRSRSGSPRRSYRPSKYSRSRSRSYSPRGAYSRRSHSRSPMSNRKRHLGDRENPEISRCLGIFGLSIHTTEHQINQIFSKFGPVERVQVVIDAKTGRSRGFCFLYYDSADDAKVAKNECTGMEIDGRRIRVDYSITQRAHTPTPGVYMGRPTYSNRDRDRDNGYERRGGRDRDEYYSRGSSYRGERGERSERGDRGDYYGGDRGRGGYGGGRGRSPSPHYRERSRRYERSRSRDRSYTPPRRYY